jgi:serine/threonine protein phosphatase PrpC
MSSKPLTRGTHDEPASRRIVGNGGWAEKIAVLMAADAQAGRVVDEEGHWVTIRVDKQNSGHDATPKVEAIHGLSTYLTVADGMGGRGAVQKLVGFPHAAIASRLALDRRLIDALVTTGTNPEHAKVIGERLHAALKAAWEGAMREGLAVASAFGGSMVSTLPTTFTMVEVSKPPVAAGLPFVVNTYNCGDSRAYVLEAASRGGLAALTTDDTCTPVDAFTALTDDPPLARFLTADREHAVTFRSHVVRSPCLVFACSDGFHHYYDTPLGLEVLLRTAMAQAVTEVDPLAAFARMIEGHFAEHHQDDVSAAILVVGGPAKAVFTGLTGPDTERDRLRDLVHEEKSAKDDRGAAMANWEARRKADFERFTEAGS